MATPLDTLQMGLHPFTGSREDLDPIIKRIGEAPVVLIGEASHGTHDFYQIRADITKRLIEEKGFNAVAVEADFPDAYRVNEYVRHQSDDQNAHEAVADFKRFPLWMWRNTVIVQFIDWLRSYNAIHTVNAQAGFYGLDLYSLYSSIDAVIQHLESVDAEAAERARQRYACFEYYDDQPDHYGYAAATHTELSCEDKAVAQLKELLQNTTIQDNGGSLQPSDAEFYAQQNARLVVDAETYYRSMFYGRANTWNLRDQHMADTVYALRDHLRARHGQAKIVIWAHNSHLGDARATEMSKRGELNLGQLIRERFQHDMVSIGFTTYTGTVSAASDWNAPVERKVVRPALPDSYELLFHELNIPRFSLDLAQHEAIELLSKPRLERAIGVIYRPETERLSHYFWTNLPRQFDMVIHIDTSQALVPLERTPTWDEREVPETFPFGE